MEDLFQISGVACQKRRLRKQFLDIRNSLAVSQRGEMSRQIWAHFVRSWNVSHGCRVMIYLNFGSEVETLFAAGALLSGGQRVIVPYCRPENRSLGIARILDIRKDLTPGMLGILEPIPSIRDRVVPEDIDMVLCPGLSFDSGGMRLGYGRSYFDNFLAPLKGRIPVIGLAFDCQISKESLPSTSHDIPVDQVITESGTLVPAMGGNEPGGGLKIWSKACRHCGAIHDFFHFT